MRRYSLTLLVLGTALCAPVVNAADITAEQSAMLYDLLDPLTKMEKPVGVNPEIYKKALDTLRTEKIILDGGRPNFQDKGLLDRYGKALFLGNRSNEFVKDIARIHDLVARGDQEELKTALTNLWVKAGRKRPDDKALEPVLNSLYETKSAQPKETINHVIDKPDHRVEIIHALAGGRMKVVITDKKEDGSALARTVVQGETETVPTDNNKELKRKIQLKTVCTSTKGSDAGAFDKLPKEWVDQQGDQWKLDGTSNDLILLESRENMPPLEYSGSLKLGRLYAAHLINRADDMGDNLPGEIRSKIAARADQTFRVNLEVCNDNVKEMQGTWSSQHVTYNPMFMSITKIHNPYDLALILERKPSENEKIAEGAILGELP